MRTQIQNLLDTNEKISLANIAKKLDTDYINVLEFAPNVRKYPVDKIDDLFDSLRVWEMVFLLVVTDGFVLEIKDKFPKGVYGHGYLNFHDTNSSIGGHLSVDKIASIYFVDDIMFNRRSCSIKFYSNEGKEIFSVYVPRDEKKELITKYLEEFNSLI